MNFNVYAFKLAFIMYHIIPQDPILFTDTLLAIVDLYETYTDQELCKSLGSAHLSSLDEKLAKSPNF